MARHADRRVRTFSGGEQALLDTLERIEELLLAT